MSKKTKTKTLEELVEEALTNVNEDRKRILDAHEKLKTALDAANQEQTVLMGKTAAVVLEQLTKANEQIVRLAQIKERQESRKSKEEEDSDPFSIDDIQKMYDDSEEKN